ncbi:hypothetical protein A4X03_0g5806 [Tilletia caries]|uniref:Tyr recombinase domain-containing protein n=1 Tax=Tilletia caries TaxID=13290 RepID=A0A8T8T276_9BASI|nr:hypothetical protein A4X03_0g5806 [Tilletia caries]
MAWAFQQLGNAPSQRSLFCMVISGLLYVWLVGIFGLASICGIFGACCDLTCHALELEFPSMLFRHYVDDFVVVDLAPPDSPLGLRSWDSILAAVRRFGWVIHPSKHFPWSRRFQYLGIVWDLDSKTATLAESKQNKFRKKLEAAYKDGALLSLKDIASLIGSCQHTCVLAMNRRSKLNALYTLRNSYRFQHPSASKHLPTNARAEVKDWLIFFNQGPISCRLDLPTSLFPMQLYTDASDFGVGIVLGSLLVSFPLPNDYTDRPGINIGVGEAWAFELGVYAAIEHGAQDCLLTVYVDNQGIVFAARRGRSRNDLANDAIDRAADAALAANVDLSIIYPLRRLLSDQQLLVPTPVASSSTLASSRPRRSLASGSRVSSSSTTSSASIPRSSSLPSLSRAEIANQALESRAHAIAFIGSLAGSDVGSFLSTADVFLSLSEDNVPTADLSAAAADALAREDIMVKLSPALHLVQAVHGSMSPHAIQQLRTFKAHRVSLDTRKGYGGHVLAFLRWADDLDHPAHLRFPIPPTIVMLFFQSSAPFYAESTLGKVYSALQCWHAIHSLPWSVDKVEARTLRQSLRNASLPPLEDRRPIRMDDFASMRRHLNMQDNAHVAIYACALISLWSMARHGELTVEVVSRPHDSRPRRSHIEFMRRTDGVATSAIVHLPADKTHGRDGFNRIVSAQHTNPQVCPVAAIELHLARNPAPDDAGVFAYRDRSNVVRELRSKLFTSTINAWLAKDDREPIKGHAFRIGGATLLHGNGISIDDIKHLGGWASDAALLYIKDIHVRHAELCSNLNLGALERPLPERAQ